MAFLIDTDRISDEIEKIDFLYEQYTDNNYSIFNELSSLDSYWQDNNYPIFEEKIKKEIYNSQLILKQLKDIIDYYKRIESLYQKYDNEEE